MRPANPTGRICPITGTIEFSIETRFLTLRLRPIMPTFRPDMASHITIDENNFSIIAPKTSQIHFGNIRIRRKLTVPENVTVRISLRRARRRDIRILLTVKCTIVEHCRCCAKNKIRRSRNITLREILPAFLTGSVDGILITQNITVD